MERLSKQGPRGQRKVQGGWSKRPAAREIPASKIVLASLVGIYSEREKIRQNLKIN